MTAAMTDAFTRNRPYLLSFAYRMTGSLAEAEDIVQDVFLEATRVDASAIENPKAWLTKVCSNKALDHLKQAYRHREAYPGTWLPDAVPDSYRFWGSLDETATPEATVLQAESLTTSFLLLAERLSPEERVVYLLAEVLEYSFKDVATFLDKTDAACRKLAQRARDALLTDRPRFDHDPTAAQAAIARFFDSAKRGDRDAIRALLADGAELWMDGGGKASTFAKHVVTDPTQIAFFFSLPKVAASLSSPALKVELTSVNGLPGMLWSKQDAAGLWTFESILTFELVDGKLSRLYVQRNPDKLGTLLRR